MSSGPGLPPSSRSPRATQAGATSLLGQVVADRYLVEAALGQGGMGSVYRAQHIHMRKTVALKVLHREMSWLPEAVARFEREAIAAGRIEHPNVATAKDFGRLNDDSYYLVLEFVEGRSLRHVLHEAGAFSEARAVHIARQVTLALSAAHAQEVVHRDLKPENIMLQREGPHDDFVKVLDFGLAKISLDGDLAPVGDEPTQLTKMGTVFGTPSYMSPEQAAAHPTDLRSDLYSLGILLYEMLTGDVPYRGDAIVVVLSQHINAPVPELPAQTTPALAALVKKLLAKDPAQRPQAADDVLRELDALTLAGRAESAREGQGGLAKVRRAVAGAGARAKLVLGPRLGAATRRATATFAALWSRALARLPALALFERRVRLGPAQVSVGMLTACSLLGVLLALAFLLPAEPAPAEAEGSHAESAEDVELFEEDDPDQAAATSALTGLSAEQKLQLEDLLALPVYKRKLPDWLSLGKLHALAGQWEQSAAAYRNAVQLDKRQKNDPELLLAIRTAAEQRKSYEAAITIATTVLEEPGLDLLYDLWMKTKDDPKRRVISELAYKKLEVMRLQASSALRVRLELEFAKKDDCGAIAKLLERAIKHADERSLPALEALKRTDGCGASKTRDCYPCIREHDDLAAAIDAARQVQGPRFDGKASRD